LGVQESQNINMRNAPGDNHVWGGGTANERFLDY